MDFKQYYKADKNSEWKSIRAGVTLVILGLKHFPIYLKLI